jgi:hypothetical protein
MHPSRPAHIRLRARVLALMLCSFLQPLHALPQAVPTAASQERDGQNDFDFDIGTWKIHSSRLQHPLTGSTSWIEMEGTTVVKKVWDGRANLAVVESDGPTGHLELLALRLYNPQTHEWTVNFATSSVGILNAPVGRPVTGGFKDGHGVFYDQEPFDGKTIFIRFTITSLGPDAAESEQAFSSDGGKTWETNWINKYTRIQ